MPVYGGDTALYDLLEKQATIAQQAAKEFATLPGGKGDFAAIAKSLGALEAEGDEATHAVTRLANDQFITPFDKEDIHSLSGALDDVTDMIEAAGARIVIYGPQNRAVEMTQIAGILVTTVDAMADAVHRLRHIKKQKEFSDSLSRIHELENRTDSAYRDALAGLFSQGTGDPLEVVKLKDILDHIELAADKCEDVAVFLEKVAVKYA